MAVFHCDLTGIPGRFGVMDGVSEPMLAKSISAPLAVFSVLSNILMLAVPIHMMQVYDRVLVSGSTSTLLYITLITAFLLVLFGMSEAIRSRLAQRLSAAYVVERAEKLFNASCEGKTGKAQANQMLRNFNTVKMFIASKAHTSLYDLPFTPVFLVLLLLVHYQIGLITVAGALLLAGVSILNRSVNDADEQEASASNSEAINFASGIVARGEDIRAMGLMPALVERWGHMTGASLKAHERANARNSLFHGVSRATRQILQISIMAWGAFLVLEGDMSGGLIFAASLISGRALQPIEQLIGGWETLNRARAASSELEAFLAAAGQRADAVAQPSPSGRLELDHVSFEIAGVTILDDASIQLKAGEFLGIIGPSGAGKSTLARIIAGAVEPSSGSVILDGCSSDNWPERQWGESVGYVGQDLHLFTGTIAENIARMSVVPDEGRVVNVARVTGVHDLINSFPDGYMTKIGEGGIRLSGGQTQRIALARAIYTHPALLVLDEPNAHLDTVGEEQLYAILKQLKAEGVTIITVSQRGRLNELADRMVLLKDGKCTEIQKQKLRPATTPPQAAPVQVQKRPAASAGGA